MREPSPERASESRERVVAASVIVGGVLLYAQSIGFETTWDDGHTVRHHPGVTGAFSLREIFGRGFWGHRLGDPAAVGTYRPLVTLSYWIDGHLAHGFWLHHLTNLLWLGAVLLLAHRLASSFPTLGARGATWVTAAFAALAIHTDVVPSITGRAELMAATGVLGALTLARVGGRRALAWALPTTLLLAMACKESALPMALAAGWLALRRDDISPRWRWGAALGAQVPLLATLAFRHGRLPLVVDERFAVSNPLIVAPRALRWAGVGESWLTYLGHLLFPIDLSPDYGWSAVHPSIGASALIGWLSLVGLGGAMAWCWRRSPAIAEAIGLLFASYVTIGHFVAPSSAFVADRTFFLPSYFLCLLVGLGISAGARRLSAARKLLPLLGGVFVLSQAALTVLSVPRWRNDETLSRSAVIAYPTNVRMLTYRGEVLHALGRPEEAAWAYVLVGVALDRFPSPLADEAAHLETFGGPDAERLGVLDREVGRGALLRGLGRAHDALVESRFRDSAAVVARWTDSLRTTR